MPLLVVVVLIAVAAGVGYLAWSGGVLTPRPVAVDIALPKGPALPDPAPMPEPQPVPAPVPRPG
ncbi:MAG: hypothetical protein Q8L23_17710 [Caulobacter sp.]|nr:hypothetical protein [Caulobacter sp.]